jgi:hypothetical protein
MAHQHSAGGLSDQLPLLVAAHAPTELAGGLALLGELQVLASHAPAPVLGFLPGNGPHDPRREAPVRGCEVVVPSSNHGQADAPALDEIDEGLKFLGERCRRSLCQVPMASMLPESMAASMRS